MSKRILIICLCFMLLWCITWTAYCFTHLDDRHSDLMLICGIVNLVCFVWNLNTLRKAVEL